CTPCHGEHGQGVIGPNLTDAYWIHGGELMQIYKTVSDGVPAKGMPPWKMQLSAIQTRELAAYVGSLRAHPVAGKAPEGELAQPPAQ
ncbi:MAG TPA: c-type cytochrome, partial [Polyangiaceae bacterium]|nr:c-type cytochrome [Polyangiaceae bacterium]